MMYKLTTLLILDDQYFVDIHYVHDVHVTVSLMITHHNMINTLKKMTVMLMMKTDRSTATKKTPCYEASSPGAPLQISLYSMQ